MDTNTLIQKLIDIAYVSPEWHQQGQQPPNLPVAIRVDDTVMLATKTSRVQIGHREYFIIETHPQYLDESPKEDLSTPVKEDPS